MDDLGEKLTTMTLDASPKRDQCYCRLRPQTFRHLHICSYLKHERLRPRILFVLICRLYVTIILSYHCEMSIGEIHYPRFFGGFLSHRATPSHHHPLLDGSVYDNQLVGLREKLQETPIFIIFHRKIMENPWFPVKIFPSSSSHWELSDHPAIWGFPMATLGQACEVLAKIDLSRRIFATWEFNGMNREIL